MNANNIKKLRKLTGKSQQDVADDLCVTLSRYRSWEQGRRSPTGAMGVKLAEYFKVSTDTVYGSSFSENLDGDSALTSDEHVLIENYQKLSPFMKRVAVEVVKALVRGDFME